MRFAKGHGTGNDFVLLPDPDDQLTLSAELVSRLCDRHAGLGGDGVLRVVRRAAGPGGAGRASRAAAGGAGRASRAAAGGAGRAVGSVGPAGPGNQAGPEWFMDYRNADGGVAEMCGNGVRVFVRYLLDRGLATGPVIEVGTRAGTRLVREEADGQLTADMGAVTMLGESSAGVDGRTCAGLALSVGNPHLACLVSEPLEDYDLSLPPVLDRDMFPAGANVELLRITGARRIEMRVHERGSGVTQSCGTGAVAAAAAAAFAAGEWPAGRPDRWTVDVTGGRLAVTPSVTASLLTGPAVIVAEGDLDGDWLAGQTAVSHLS